MKTEKDRLLAPKYKHLPSIYKKSLRKKFTRIAEDFKGDISLAVSRIIQEFKRLSNVKKIAHNAEGKRLTIWTFVDNYEYNSLTPIYDKELEIIEQFSRIEFSFNTIFNPDEDAPIGFTVDYLDKWHQYH
ncbi:MAG: hypothetical protein HQL04_06325 [Nitrospirae bacterium]|nr:hypothetical protein [Nitrospirota bacterium]